MIAARLMPYLRCAWRAAIAALSKKQKPLGVVPGRAHCDEGVLVLALHHLIGGGHGAADAAHHGFPGARRHRGVAVDIDHARSRRDVAQFADIVLAMAEQHGVEVAFRREVAHQRLETVFAKHLGDRAQPVGAFGMSGWGQVIEAGGVRQKQCHAISRRNGGACEDALM